MSFFTISPESYKFRFIYFDGKGVIPFRQPASQKISFIRYKNYPHEIK
ncbi:hypothetical protein CSB69_2980 [Morganella morganii]|nr:hypothetical protein CSB69_2980 [Morganella morganii]EMP52977.1 hypothetical protein C790_02953 [Morganella morganii SC01]